ncbi:MAG: PrsW family glutamic-type intramembrane protease [Bacteroidales bacterium]
MGILVASLAPVLIILVYVYIRDKYEKEPAGLLLTALVAGALITLPVVIVEGFFSGLRPDDGTLGAAFYRAFVVAAFTEELFKFAALYLLIWKRPAFNEQFDGIVYAVFVSLGFAAVENVLYVTGSGYQTALLRALTAVPAHAIFGVTMGYYLGIARRYEEVRKSFLWKALALPVLLHGIYDFILMSGIPWLLFGFVIYVGYLYKSGFRRIRVLSDASVYRESDGEQETI